MAEKFTGTQKSGPLNSTDFTTCCGLAVIWPAYWHQETDVKCPGCGATVRRPFPPPYTPNCRMCGSPRDRCYC